MSIYLGATQITAMHLGDSGYGLPDVVRVYLNDVQVWPDTDTWTATRSAANAGFGLAWASSGSLVAGAYSYIRTSTNGTTWTTTSYSSAASTDAGGYGGGKFVLIDADTDVAYTSTTGTTWTTSSSVGFHASYRDSGTAHRRIAYGGGTFVGIREGTIATDYVQGNELVTSTSGTSWTALSGSPLDTGGLWGHSDILYSDGIQKFVLVGHDGSGNFKAATSANASSWSLATVPTIAAGGQLIYTAATNTRIAALLSGGQVIYSSDGSTWTSGTTLSASSSFAILGSVGGRFVAIAQNNLFYTSTDAVTWTQHIMPSGCNMTNQWAVVGGTLIARDLSQLHGVVVFALS